MLTSAALGKAGGSGLGEAVGVEAEQFSELLGTHAQVAYRLALTMLREPGLAEDAVQEAALRAWKRRTSLRDAASFRPWFLAVVANECRSVRRGRWFRLGSPVEAPERGVPPQADATDQRVDLARSLSRLGAEDRLAVYLYYYLDMTVEDAAASMRCSQAAFRSRLARAVRRLRPGLELEDFARG
jgi:RNA polymerase sigma-70 factor (ECF subfamily)